MAFDTAEKRFSAIHLTKRSGPPVPKALVDESSRLHFIGIFSNLGSVVPSPFFNWRNKNRIATSWQPKVTPQDGSTQTI